MTFNRTACPQESADAIRAWKHPRNQAADGTEESEGQTGTEGQPAAAEVHQAAAEPSVQAEAARVSSSVISGRWPEARP
jgi:hypothetical protein